MNPLVRDTSDDDECSPNNEAAQRITPREPIPRPTLDSVDDCHAQNKGTAHRDDPMTGISHLVEINVIESGKLAGNG